MADVNRSCSECGSSPAQLVCRCTYPATFLCTVCLGPHYAKSPDAIHLPMPISPNDLEDTAGQVGHQNGRLQDSKRSMLDYSYLILKDIETYAVNRCNEIDEIMTRFQIQSSQLKDQIMVQKGNEEEKVRKFVQEFADTENYDYLIKYKTVQENAKILQLQLLEPNHIQQN